MLTPNDIAKCERWFVDHGLPLFVESTHSSLQRALQPRVWWLWAGFVTAAALVAGVVVGLATRDLPTAVEVAAVVAALGAAARFVRVFRVGAISRWAGRHAWAHRRLLVPLATRALPFLLLFITFLFINTEVWMVASALRPGLLWTCVAIFAAIATAFLQQPFREEVDRVGLELEGQRLVEVCAGTPVASAARELQEEPDTARAVAGISLPVLQRRNLFLMLFITQTVQVVLLASVVWAFFVIFGAVAIRPEVVEAWLGHPPNWLLESLNLSYELLHVAVFLSAFAGLYFTVQAVVDQNYRREFFTHVREELERAVGVRKVYVALNQHLAARSEG